jgi:hypothetical protein
MSSFRSGRVALLISAAFTMLGSGTALAAPAAWSGPLRVDLSGGTTLTAVACPSINQCVAVDNEGRIVTFDPAAPQTAAAVSVAPGQLLSSVACPSTSRCVAVGPGAYTQDGAVVVFDPAAPAGATVTSFPAFLTPTVVACPAVDQCTVASNYSVFTFDPAAPVISPAILASGLTALACPSTALCVAGYGAGAVATFDPAQPGAATLTAGVGSAAISGIACPLPNQCTAVDNNGREQTFAPDDPGAASTAMLSDDGAALVACPTPDQCTAMDYSGGQMTFDPLPAPASRPTPTLTGVAPAFVGLNFAALACPSAHQCTTVGDGGAQSTFDPTAPGSPAPATVAPGTQLRAVSCAAMTQCAALDSAGRIVTFDPTAADGAGAVRAGDGLVRRGISCPAVSQCSAVGYAGRVTTFDPRAPGTPGTEVIAGGNDLAAVTCPRTDLCVAVGAQGFAGFEISFDPADPHGGTLQTLGTNPLNSVACPSATQCTAAGDSGGSARLVTFTPHIGGVPTGINRPAASNAGSFNAIDCPTESQCTAVGTEGKRVTFNPTETGPTAAVVTTTGALVGVSCPAVDDCIALRRNGGTAEGDPQTGGEWTVQPVARAAALNAITCDGLLGCVAVDGVGQAVRSLVLPVLATGAASGVSDTAATLAGMITPRYSATTWHFEYGTTAAYDLRALASDAAAGSDNLPHAVSQALSGLAPGTTYHYRLVATNGAGIVTGEDRTFTTSPAPVVPTPTPTPTATPLPEPPAFVQPAPRLPAAGAVTVKLVSGRMVVTVGRTLSCPAGGASCRATVTLVTVKKFKVGRKRHTISLGTAVVSALPGANAVLRVRLSRAATALLRRERRLSVRLAASAIAGTVRSAPVSRTITVRAPGKNNRG